MNTLKQQFSEIRKSMPKHVQWLLLVAAFLVVLILLFLLLSGGNESSDASQSENTQTELFIDPAQVDWSNTKIGTPRTQKITVTASGETKITSVKFSKEIDGLTFNSSCTNMGRITDKISCTITLNWKADKEIMGTGTEIQIMYHAANVPENMVTLESVPVLLSTDAVVPVANALPAPSVAAPVAPVPAPAPAAPVAATVAEPVAAPSPVSMQDSLNAIAEMSQEEIDALLADTPSLGNNTKPADVPPAQDYDNGLSLIDANLGNSIAPESCYEFAFAGYGLSGQQTGWIRPYRGGYRFHPFSDVNCDAPIGVYNPDTGMITDINDASKKIGTDAERIGYRASGNLAMPVLSNPASNRTVNRATQLADIDARPVPQSIAEFPGGAKKVFTAPKPASQLVPSSAGDAVISSEPYDRTFVLRQYKPIPATIVSEIRADPKNMSTLPVMATVDRNVYSDNGRTIIVPTGTLMLGYVTGELPGPYKAIGRMQVNWYRFVRPDGVEFNFNNDEPFSGDAQGRVGVPGHGSTDYIEQFLMPMITAIVPAAVNMIAPISDRFVNQIDLDNNTVVQSGNIRSSELAKNEIITAWNRVAQKLAVDMMDNTTPPFSIAAGTRITVYSPKDLIVNFCGKVDGIDTCDLTAAPYVPHKASNATPDYSDASWVGQVRSFDMSAYCGENGEVKATAAELNEKGIDYRTVVAYCQASQYQAISNAQWQQYYNQQASGAGSLANTVGPVGSMEYNNQVLGMNANNDTGLLVNPFAKEKAPAAEVPPAITCEDGVLPDANGCCTGETYTDMGDAGFNCCPAGGGDCFPPII